MEHVLQQGLFQVWEPVGVEASVHNKLVEVGGFADSDRGRCDEVMGGCI